MAIRPEDRAAHQELGAHGAEAARRVVQRVALEVRDEVVEAADHTEGRIGAVEVLQAEAVGAKILLRSRIGFADQSGKTFFVRHTLPNARVYDLLDTSVLLTLSQRAGRIAEEMGMHDTLVVIDEIHGSIARKLRRGGVNLLGGRARTRHLHFLSWRELGAHFDLERFAALCNATIVNFS